MDSIDFDYVAIVHDSEVEDYCSTVTNLYSDTEVFKMSVGEFLDRINEESIYYKTFTIIDDKFNIKHTLTRLDFEDYLDNGKLDALVELYDEVYIDSIRYYTTEQLGKDMTVLLFN